MEYIVYCIWVIASGLLFWSPQCRKDVETMKRVHLLLDSSECCLEWSISYKSNLDFFFREHQTLQGDLMEVGKIMRGIQKVDCQSVFPPT